MSKHTLYSSRSRGRTAIASLARNRVVEHLVTNVTKRPAKEMGDLAQMVYEILLTKPPHVLEKVIRNNALPYYIVAIIRNLYFSKTSPYYRKIRRFETRRNGPQE